ncbi:MAG: radical SAM protein [Syntrophaceae bacterium]|nr:radical SAM protein [Syntrophaceae bacterium]
MRVLLISANTEQINILPLPLGLNCVAMAVRNAGHEVRLLDLMVERDYHSSVREVVLEFSPDIVGISVRNIDDQEIEGTRFLLDPVKRVVRECRDATEAPIVLGGAGYSIFPEAALEYLEADMGIQGEGEAAFPLLLDRIERKESLAGTPGLHVRGLGLMGPRMFADNLDALPLPDAALSALSAPDHKECWMPMQSRRGCPMDCSYCSTATIEGRAVRRRSPESFLRGIAAHVEAGFRHFYFVDNTFNLPRADAREICTRLIESRLGISWRCIFYPGSVDPELIRLMAGAGCTEVSLGFESGCESILKRLNKKFGPDDVRRSSDLLRDAGIRRMGFLLLGGPGETRETVEKSLSFVDSLNLDSLKITVGIRIYPHTSLARDAVREGLLLPGDNLFRPRFYLVPELREWLPNTVKCWMADRSNRVS